MTFLKIMIKFRDSEVCIAISLLARHVKKK